MTQSEKDLSMQEREKKYRSEFVELWRSIQNLSRASGVQVRQPGLAEVLAICEPLKELWKYNRRPDSSAIHLSQSYIDCFQSLYKQAKSTQDKLTLLGILHISTQTCFFSLSELFSAQEILNLKEDFYQFNYADLSTPEQYDWNLFASCLLQSELLSNETAGFTEVQQHVQGVLNRHQNLCPEALNRIIYLEILQQAVHLEWEKVEQNLNTWIPEKQELLTPEWIIKKAFLLAAIPRGENLTQAYQLCELALKNLDKYPLTEQTHLLEAYYFLQSSIYWNSKKNTELWDKSVSLKAIFGSFTTLIDAFIDVIKQQDTKSKELPEKARRTTQGKPIFQVGVDSETSKTWKAMQALNTCLSSGLLPALRNNLLIRKEDWELCSLLTYSHFPLYTLFLSLSYGGNDLEEKWLRIFLRRYIYHPEFTERNDSGLISQIFGRLCVLWKHFDIEKNRFNNSILILLSELLIIIPYHKWDGFFDDFWSIFNNQPELKRLLYDHFGFGAYQFLEKALQYIENPAVLKTCLLTLLDISEEEVQKINLLASLSQNKVYQQMPHKLIDPDIESKIHVVIEAVGLSSLNIKALVNIQKMLTDEHKGLIAEKIAQISQLPLERSHLSSLLFFSRHSPAAQAHLKKLILSQHPLWPTGIYPNEDGQLVYRISSGHVTPFRRLRPTKYFQQGLVWQSEELKTIYQELVKACKEFKQTSFGASGLQGMNAELLQEMKYFLEDNQQALEALHLDDFSAVKQEIGRAYQAEMPDTELELDFFTTEETVIRESLMRLRQSLVYQSFSVWSESWKDLLTRILAQIEPRLDNCLEFMVDWLVHLSDEEKIRENKFVQLYLKILIRYQQLHLIHPDPLFIQTQMIRLAQVLAYWKYESPAIDYFLNLKQTSVLIPIRNLPDLPLEIIERQLNVPVEGLNSQIAEEKGTSPVDLKISKIGIQNYKSVKSVMLELGKINVFIGENGAGKSNILEALAFSAAAYGNVLPSEFLPSRGIRETKSKLMKSAFQASDAQSAIQVDFKAMLENNQYTFKSAMDVQKSEENWSAILSNDANPEQINRAFSKKIQRFVVFSPNYDALRNFNKEGQIKPLGIGGEGLLELLQSFKPEKITKLQQLMDLFSWFEALTVPESQHSAREVLITDRHLKENIPAFNQYSANEGFLFALFYFSLFLSDRTPTFFAVDNIDASLNPKLCERLIQELCRLAPKCNKQAIFTTHNPAILDGLDLHDPAQKLFIVSRSQEGHTRVKPVKPLKPLEGQAPVRLSEAFMRGYLGGLPENF